MQISIDCLLTYSLLTLMIICLLMLQGKILNARIFLLVITYLMRKSIRQNDMNKCQQNVSIQNIRILIFFPPDLFCITYAKKHKESLETWPIYIRQKNKSTYYNFFFLLDIFKHLHFSACRYAWRLVRFYCYLWHANPNCFFYYDVHSSLNKNAKLCSTRHIMDLNVQSMIYYRLFFFFHEYIKNNSDYLFTNSMSPFLCLQSFKKCQ